MNPVRALAALSLAVLLAALASACAGPGPIGGAAPGDAAHTAHQPDAMSTPPGTEQRMMAMQAMHQKMANANTPAERQALMAEHMKAMQGGMEMLNEMHCMGGKGTPPAGSAEHERMMADHMAMMKMMMAMMADRMPPAAPAP